MDIMDELAQMPVQRKTYFVQAENAFLRNSAYTSNEIRVYLILCTYAGVKAHCFPGQNGIAKHMGISRNRVNQILKDLEKKNGIAFYHLIRKTLSPQKSTKQSSQ